MKKLKKHKKLLFLGLLTFVLSLYLYKPNPNRKRETYINLISKNFNDKLKNTPSWMEDQIEDDLNFVKNKKVTQEALAETFKTMKSNFEESKKDFCRYRIVNNELYQLFLKDEKVTKKEEAFEKALKTLLRLKKIPDVDFIFSNIDGLPSQKNEYGNFFYYENKRNFYLTKNSKLQAPIFTRAKSSNVKEGILIPDYFVLSELWPKFQKEILEMNDSFSWNKKLNCAHWRGASSKQSRFTLCEMSLKSSDIINAGFAEVVNDWKIKELEKWNKTKRYSFLTKPFASLKEQLSYKYLPVLDGVMCTYPGYQWRLLSNSLVFKQSSDEKQWFYNALKPYEHFIPIENDMSDLVEKTKWAMKNDEKCKEIAENATAFVLDNLMIEDVYVYLYNVLKNYAKYQDFDKKILNKDILKNPNWISISNRRKANIILKKKNYEFF